VDPMTMFDDVFAERPSHLEAEREEFGELLKAGVLKP
jgi:hypothetical protein